MRPRARTAERRLRLIANRRWQMREHELEGEPADHPENAGARCTLAFAIW
jgi:hypothetical protein